MKRFILGATSAVVLGGGGIAILAARFEEEIKPGTYVGPVPIGGLSRDEAMRKLRVWWEMEKGRSIEVSVRNSRKTPISVPLSRLGYVVDDVESVRSLPLESFWEAGVRTISSSGPDRRDYPMRFRPAGNGSKWLGAYVKEAIGEARPARVRFADGAIVREPEIAGYELDEAALPEAVIAAVQGEARLDVPIAEAAKRVPDEELAKIVDVVSEYSTRFPAGQHSRNANLNLASGKIDGLVLMPGESFSFNETVGQRTMEDGYRLAPVLLNGRHDTGIGGGICQVSSTLYNAVAFANLKVLVRQNHSLPSTYVSVGRDATVSWPSLDFRFQNDSGRPIAISRTYQPGKLTFRILGKKIPGQAVKLVGAGHRSWGRGEKIEHDPTLPYGKRKVVEKGSSGHVITMYRVVYQNGREVKREQFNYSRYAGSPRIIAANLKAKPPVEDADAPPPVPEPPSIAP